MSDIKSSMLMIPVAARDLASLRSPRMSVGAINENTDWVSREITIGNFVVDPKTGEWMHTVHGSLEETLEAWLKPRPHALLPLRLEDPVDTTWTSGSITQQGARFKAIRATTNTDAEALAQLTEEAAAYGVKIFTTEKGKKIDQATAGRPKSASASNPYSDAYVKQHGLDAAYLERARLMKTLNLKACASLAASAGVSVTGVKLQ